MRKGVIYPFRVHSVGGKRIIVRENKTHVQRVSERIPHGTWFTDQNGLRVQEGAMYGIDPYGNLYDIEPLVPFCPSEY